MKVFMRIHDHSDVQVECKTCEIRHGVIISVDGVPCQMLIVITDEGVYHPVIDVEVM